jgi:benzoyl-CoA reductase subunit D
MPERILTGGLDVGARSVKIAILSHEETRSVVLAKALIRIPARSDARSSRFVMRESWGRVLADAGMSAADIDYVASTGRPDRQLVRVARFYEPSTHAVGAGLLFSDAAASLDIGTDQIRCALVGEPPNGRRYAAARRDAEPMLLPASLALQDELAESAIRLLHSLVAEGKVVLTGGMALDAGFVRRLWARLLESGSNFSLLISPQAPFAGAYGAAMMAAVRYRRISGAVEAPAAPPERRILGIDRRTLN